MKFSGLILSCVVVLLFWSSASDAQDLFGGHGIRSSNGSANEGQSSGNRWSNLLDFSTDKKPEQSRFQMFRAKSGSDRTKMNWFRRSESNADGLLGGMPSLLPKRDPNAPGFFQQLNSKSRDFVDRTSGWAQRQNQSFRSKSFDRWDAITKDLGIPQPKLEQSGERSEFGMQPPVRSAESLKDKPKVRF
jgi:hypothetical protein